MSGRTVVITGAGAGVGQALALGLVARGAHVLALGRSDAGLRRTRELCQGPGSVDCQTVDVTDEPALRAAFSGLVAARGGFDLVVNCAAVYPRLSLRDTGAAQWASGVATNLDGTAYVCMAAIHSLPPQRSAVVLNVGSFAHLGPEPNSTLYCATKAAVQAFTQALAVELAAQSSPLVVNTWVPGIYRTQMSGQVGEPPEAAVERLLAVWRQSLQGPGGRVFERDTEWLPYPPSWRGRLKSRVKRLLGAGA